MVFLTEVMDTRYLCNALSGRLNKALTALPDGEVVDVNRIKFGPAAYSVVMCHMNRLEFINSGDAELNEILKSCTDSLRNESPVNMELPEIASYEDIVSFVKNIPEGLPYYKFPQSTNINVQYAIIALVLARTDVTIDISNRYLETFSVLKSLGCPETNASYYVSVDNSNYLLYKQPPGKSVSAPCIFGLGAPIDLENPDPKHLFYKIIVNMKSNYEKQEYCSFIQAAKKLT